MKIGPKTKIKHRMATTQEPVPITKTQEIRKPSLIIQPGLQVHSLAKNRNSKLRKFIFLFLISWTLASLVLFTYYVHHDSRVRRFQKAEGQTFPKRSGDSSTSVAVLKDNVTNPVKNLEQHMQSSSKKGAVKKTVKVEKQKVIKKVIKESTPEANGYMSDNWYLKYNMKCPTTLRHKMASNRNLKRKYVADVPVLLSPEHVTMPEYNRLKRFRDAMGWKSAKFEAITEAMSLLNTSSNRYLFDDLLVNDSVAKETCVRCAVVGNGGILNGSRIGDVIDSHDYVFRTNVALTKGYEEDVGNKTSFYCFGMKTLSNSVYYMKDEYGFRNPPWNPGIRYVFMAEDDWAYRYIRAALTNNTIPKGNVERYAKREPFLFSKPLVAKDIKVLHPDFLRYIENRWLRSSKLKKFGRATTGAIMIFLALHTCDEVNAFGFMGDPKKYTSHYYDRKFVRSDLGGAAWHDWTTENQIWKLLEKEGVLNVYTRQ